MAASLEGLDVLVFTEAVGEGAATIRARSTAGLRFLGLAVDGPANQEVAGEGDISAPGPDVATLVVRVSEDLVLGLQSKHAWRREVFGQPPHTTRRP